MFPNRMRREVTLPQLLAALVLATACGRGGLADFEAYEGFGGSGARAGSGGSGAAGAGGAGAGGAGGMGGMGGSGLGGMGGSTGGMGGAGGAGGTQEICRSFGDPCTSCASVNCPEIWCGCQQNPECLSLFNCFGMCMGDPGCQSDCLASHENGISDVLLVSGCAGTTCDASCQFGNPDFTPCQECAFSSCGTEWNACLATADCLSLWQCFQGCEPLDLTCQQDCYASFPDGVELLEDALTCSNAACSDVCP
jgi:hypothetical protein